TLGTDALLAIHLSELGEYQAARELGEDTLTRYRRVLGNDHPNTLCTARNFVPVLRGLGQAAQADALQSWIDNATKLAEVEVPAGRVGEPPDQNRADYVNARAVAGAVVSQPRGC